MKKFFIPSKNITATRAVIDSDQHTHLAKVLRSEVGENILCICGDQFEYLCEIVEISKKSTTTRVLEKRLCTANPKFNITIFQGFAKGEKLELVTQKCTELGAKALCLFESQFTIAKDTHSKANRLQKISEEACKQCGRSQPLEILPSIKLKNITPLLKKFDLVLFFFEHAEKSATLPALTDKILSAKNIAIIIGAEGGFSEEENQFLIEIGATPVSLGNRILRTETASIATTAFVSFLKGN